MSRSRVKGFIEVDHEYRGQALICVSDISYLTQRHFNRGTIITLKNGVEISTTNCYEWVTKLMERAEDE